ncbi:MAG TPA: pyridoxal phosphate-dependent aminotransferase family protein [Polyangiaceae bacterium]|nr:pyridoxal phosphate-dependent aminotransferase family protein [Polyangiaceae bacterium]
MTTAIRWTSTPSGSWAFAKARGDNERIRKARVDQVYPFFREFETGGLHTEIAGKPVTNFSSNDYLGLTNHPKVKEAAKRAVDKYGCGLSSSRPQATTVEHVELERRLAKWLGFESCLLFTTGYQAMVGALVALADKDTTIALDAYSHACILDGAFLAAGVPKNGPEIRFFNHNSAKSLERILTTRERKNALVVVEGVYSLDGDTAKLDEFVALCERYDALLIVDDAHGSGTMGAHGKGTLEAMGLEGRVPIVVSTLSKTFGGIGGLLFGPSELVEQVKNSARSFLFSASLPVPVVAAASTILDMVESDGDKLVAELHEKARYMRGELVSAGFDLGASNTHIMPIMCREERKTLFMHIALLECGVLMVPLVYPSVKNGEERLRVNVTRGHTQEDLDRAISLLKEYGDAFFVISGEDIGPLEE